MFKISRGLSAIPWNLFSEWTTLNEQVLVWIAETRIAEMIEIEEKPELPKRVYCTRPDFPKWTN